MKVKFLSESFRAPLISVMVVEVLQLETKLTSKVSEDSFDVDESWTEIIVVISTCIWDTFGFPKFCAPIFLEWQVGAPFFWHWQWLGICIGFVFLFVFILGGLAAHRMKTIRKTKLFDIEKWNVGNCPKCVLAKFCGCASSVRGVNGRSKFHIVGHIRSYTVVYVWFLIPFSLIAPSIALEN